MKQTQEADFTVLGSQKAPEKHTSLETWLSMAEHEDDAASRECGRLLVFDTALVTKHVKENPAVLLRTSSFGTFFKSLTVDGCTVENVTSKKK